MNESKVNSKIEIEELYTASTYKKLKELNDQYAACVIGTDFRIINDQDKHRIEFLKKSTFQNSLLNQTGIKQMSDGRQKECQLSDLWLRWSERRSYTRIAFEPDTKKCNKQTYNLFTGFPVEPKEGSCKLLYAHIKNILCKGNQEYTDYILDWMARLIQAPGSRRPGVAIVLKGGKGCGKGIFVNYIGKIFGNSYKYISNEDHLLGRFNNDLATSLLIFIDEAIAIKNKRHESQLKAFITEPVMTYEQKGIDKIVLDNHANIIMASNDSWCVPATLDERRFFVLDVSSEKIGNYEYFNALAQEMDNGGVEAFYYDMLRRQYDFKKLSLPPRTEALIQQAEYSLDIVWNFWKEVLSRGYLLSDDSGSPVYTKKLQSVKYRMSFFPRQVFKNEVYNEFTARFCKKDNDIVYNSMFWKKTKELFGASGVRYRQQHDGIRFVELEDSENLKRMFFEKTGIIIEDD